MRRTRPEEEMRACSCSHGPLSASSLEPTRHRTPWLGVPHRPSCCRSGAAATAAAALAFVCEAATTKVRWPAPWSFIHAGPAALPVIQQWCRAGMICVALSLSHGQISRAGSSSGGGAITMAAAQCAAGGSWMPARRCSGSAGAAAARRLDKQLGGSQCGVGGVGRLPARGSRIASRLDGG